MGMPRDRIVVVGLLAIAGVGLIADRTVFRAEACAAEPVGTEPPSLAAAGAGMVQTAVAGMIRDQFRAAFKPGLADRAGELDFGPAAEWMTRQAPAMPPSPAEGTPLVQRPAQEAGLPMLTLVMPTRSGGVAVIDGVRLGVGQSHPSGFKLLSVGDRTATILRNGRAVELSMTVAR